MEARCAGCKAMGSWRLAAYGSSGLEESAQDRDLEERHVICARASGTVASVRAGVASGPAAGGLRVRGLWSVPASRVGAVLEVSCAFRGRSPEVPFRLRTRCDHPASAPSTWGGGVIECGPRARLCLRRFLPGLNNLRGICRGRVAVGLHAGLTGAQPVIRKRAASGEARAIWLLLATPLDTDETQTTRRVGNELRDRRAQPRRFCI